MEQIIRKGNRYYYGEQKCYNADDAYCRFRDDYHSFLGKRTYQHLDKIGYRKERVHGSGFVFSSDYAVCSDFFGKMVEHWYLGLVSGSYCKMLRGRDIPDRITEDAFGQWLDWVFWKNNRRVKLCGRNSGIGRTKRTTK